jgi:peptidyl-prolyl cis-trans isomerase D
MMNWLRKRNKEILIITFATFIIGSVAFTGAQSFSVTPFSAVLVVNGEKIPYKRFDQSLQQRIRQNQGTLSDQQLAQMKTAVLQELVQETALLQEADRFELTVTNRELAYTLQSIPTFQREGRFDQNLYMAYLAQGARETPAVFEESVRRDLKRQKLMMLVASTVKMTEAEVDGRLSTLSAEEKAAIKDPSKVKEFVAQEESRAVMQSWLAGMSSRLKVENRLDRWEKNPSM